MTNIQMKNKEKAIKWIHSLTEEEFEVILTMWDKIAYEDSKEHEKALKAICKAHGVAYKYVEEWLWE